jgi:adenylate cyclase
VVSQGEAGHSSPFGALSGLEVLGTAVANSLEGDGLATWPAAPWQRALLAAGTVALAALLALSRPSLGWRLAVVSVALALQLLAVALALTLTSRWLQLLAPASGLVVLGLISSGDAYLREGRERRRLRRTFERYVAPSVVAEILADPAAAEGMLRGRVREVTVLFADLQGFTDLTRRRSAAGESELHVRQLNTYLGAMVEVISAHGGTVDKFIGDAVMAVFGSPVSRGVEQEAAAAVRCALAMRARLEQLNAIWREQGVEPLASGVGLASGVVLAGQIGSPQRLEFTVIGDTVNLASRLESLTRRLPSSVCIDTATARLLSGDSRFVLRSFGLHEIKGLEATEVFAVEPAAGLAAGACAAQPPS